MIKKDLVKEGIRQGCFPKILYKYRAFIYKEDICKNNQYGAFNDYTTEAICKNNQLWFSKSNEFNDPFEFRICDKGGYSKEDICDYFISQGIAIENANELANNYAKAPNELIKNY